MNASRSATLLLLVALVLPALAGARYKPPGGPTIRGAYVPTSFPEAGTGSLFISAPGSPPAARLLQPSPADTTLSGLLGKLPVLFQAVVLPPLQGYASAT